jgi:hypothetical protein
MAGIHKVHAILSQDEQNAIVNALAFYDRFYTGQVDADERAFCSIAHKEDAARVNLDALATAVARLR